MPFLIFEISDLVSIIIMLESNMTSTGALLYLVPGTTDCQHSYTGTGT
jgi:hypothetical protein